MTLTHFLLTYDLRNRRLDVQRFDDAAEATAAYGQAEMRHLDDHDTEIVLVGADSIETVMKTHGHYFNQGATVELPELAAP